MNLIGISGKIYAGKDTVGWIIQEALQEADDSATGMATWEIKKFATKLKKICSLLIGVPEELFEDQRFKSTSLNAEWDNLSVRLLLQKVGTDAIRDKIHKDAWVNALFADYNPESKWVITDVRFPNEVEAIKKKGGLLIRVKRPGTAEENLHESETALDNYNFDYTIINDGSLSHLRSEVIKMLTEFNAYDSTTVENTTFIKKKLF